MTFGANAQQKLIGHTSREYDQTGSLTYNDSSEYVYNSWEGSLTSNEPEFTFDSPVFDWVYKLPTAQWNEENRYTGMPLQLTSTRQNTVTGGQLIDSEIAQSDRQVYTYDAAGNLTKIEYFFWNVSQFDIQAESNFEYDANNNLTLESYVSDPIANPITESLDSMFYDASNNLIRMISYNWSGSALEVQSESLMTYSGNEIDNLQLYEANSSQLEWTYDLHYTHSGGMPASIDAFSVTGGVPSTSADIEISYTYNSDNQLSLHEAYLLGDLLSMQEYIYDAEGFVEKIEFSDFDFASSSLYISQVRNFYYQSTADLTETSAIATTVYPNPTSDFISVEADAHIERVTVLATDGKMLITQKGSDVDVSHLTPGAYLINVTTSKGSSQTRFIKH